MIPIDWIEVPAGEFIMGLSDEHVQKLKKDIDPKYHNQIDDVLAPETPQRVVDVQTFYVSRFPVTWEQFDEFAGSDYLKLMKWKIDRWDMSDVASEPVHCHWHLAGAFCHWIGARLPSTFEWEKAARGTDGRLYPWGDEWDIDRGNFDPARNRASINRYGHKSKHTPVNAYPEGISPYGVYDMAGNSFEWTMTHTLHQDPYQREHQPDHWSQQIVIRSSPVSTEWPANPIAYRVTNFMIGGVMGDSPNRTGFRPVMDEWQRHYFLGASSGEVQAKDIHPYSLLMKGST